ncbi:MAG: EamA family transporter [Clostridia bacterium]|nr:EamA family transporter [Clostridia bacterium]
MKHDRIHVTLMMHGLFLVYSLTTVISKKIGGAAPLSAPFLVGLGLIFLCLGIYALGWQKVLQAMPLSRAFAHKAVVVIWGLFWGWVLFGETLTPAKIAGAAVIICGVLLFAFDEKDSGGRKEGGAHG